MRHREEDRHDDGREQLEVVRVELQPEDDDHDRIVDHAAEHHKQQPDGKITALCEDRVAEHLADDDRGESNDDRAAAAAIAAVAATIGRLAMDACLFMSQNFGFISLPDELTTGSSIMPHKKNPDVFEIMRGRCNRLQSVPNEIALLTTNLPVGYHRDLQLMKDILFPATTEIKRTLRMCDFMLAHLRVNEHILDDRKYDYLFTVEDVNRLVLQGVPFREAYRQVGMAVQRGEYTPTREVRHTHEGSIGNLCTAEIRQKMERVLEEFV